jgi:hypothetical protein
MTLSPPRRPSTAELRHLVAALAFAALVLVAGPAAAAAAGPSTLSVPMYVPPASARAKVLRVAPPLRLAATADPAPLAALPAAAQTAGDQLAALRAWNDAGRQPVRIGLVRDLPASRAVALRAAGLAPGAAPRSADGGVVVRTPDGRLVWGAEVTVSGAHALRLHLSDVRLPAGARLWLYAGDKADAGPTVGPFGPELAWKGGLWTPSLAAATARLEVEIPAADTEGDWGFTVDRVAEVLAGEETATFSKLGSVTAALDTACLTDVSCVDSSTFPVVEEVESAIAHLQFIVGQFLGVCTGGLLNNTADDGTPYLLTANHCISSTEEAASLEAFWDFHSSSCDGPLPTPASLPTSNGATLLATGTASDYTLLLLDSIPAGRVFLGWNANPIAANTVLHRVHHPVPASTILRQSYTRIHYLAQSFNLCDASTLGQQFNDPGFFHHGEQLLGGEFSGSSGAPLVTDEGRVVGQLFGSCGPAPEEGCDDRNNSLDGAFSASFAALQPYLAPSDVCSTDPCVADATTLCLRNGRYRVTGQWATDQGTSGDAMAESLGLSDTGYFWFFNSNNVEMVVKVLNGCPVNGRYWVFAGGLTNVQVEMQVCDTQEGVQATYSNPQSKPFQPIQDTGAFATCP